MTIAGEKLLKFERIIMTYWFEDAKGKFLDHLSIGGAAELSERKDALGDFIRTGKAEKRHIPEILKACEKDAEVHFIVNMLKGATPPVILTAGKIADSHTARKPKHKSIGNRLAKKGAKLNANNTKGR
jgi:hypothetical protein